MKKPEMEIVKFHNEDVIATSSTSASINFWNHIKETSQGAAFPYHTYIKNNGDNTYSLIFYDGYENHYPGAKDYEDTELSHYPGYSVADSVWYYVVPSQNGGVTGDYDVTHIICDADHEHMEGFPGYIVVN